MIWIHHKSGKNKFHSSGYLHNYVSYPIFSCILQWLSSTLRPALLHRVLCRIVLPMGTFWRKKFAQVRLMRLLNRQSRQSLSCRYLWIKHMAFHRLEDLIYVCCTKASRRLKRTKGSRKKLLRTFS